jgi:hypothetical protein
MRAFFLGLAAVVVAGMQPVLAHPGGLNSAGCHNNRRTGDYHCHGGGGYSGGGRSGGGGGYSSPGPQPVCEDVTRNSTDVTLVTIDGRRMQSSNVSVKKVSARLEGVSGKLYSYVVDGLAVRNFVDSSGSNAKFSFANSSWIPVVKTEENGDTLISTLQPNGIGVSQEEYTTRQYQDRVCR